MRKIKKIPKRKLAKIVKMKKINLKIYKKEQENQSKSKLSTASTNFALNS